MPFILTISHVDPFPTQLQQQRTRSILRNGFVVETISKRKRLYWQITPWLLSRVILILRFRFCCVRQYAKKLVVSISNRFGDLKYVR